MRTLITCAMLAMFGVAVYGCDSTDTSGSKHETVEKKTVTDANGNVVQQSESKTNDTHNP